MGEPCPAPARDADHPATVVASAGGAGNRVTGVVGVAVQAGVVHGDVHVHRPRRGRPVWTPPRQLPPDVLAGRFADRAVECAEFERVLERGVGVAPTVIVVHGPGGVGKTALALTVLAGWVARFPDGQLYADLGRGEPPGVVLGRWLRACGVPPEVVPDTEVERAEWWRTLTATRRLAVLLESPTHAEDVVALLPSSPHTVTVITSRDPLVKLVAAGATPIRVGPLDEAGCRELLERFLGADHLARQAGAVRELAALCGGSPLALSVAAAQVATTRPGRPLADTVTALRTHQEPSVNPHSATGPDVAASLEAAYTALAPAAARAYRMLGVCPGRRISPELAATALDTTVDTATGLLVELVAVGLLTRGGAHGYLVHDLVAQHAHTAAGAGDESDAVHTLRRCVVWYLRTARLAAATVMPGRRALPDPSPDLTRYVAPAGIGEYATALAWLDDHRADLACAALAAADHGWHRLVIGLADALRPGAVLLHDPTLVEDELALRAALALGDTLAELSVRKRLARGYARVGDQRRAVEHVRQALRASRGQPSAAYAGALKSWAFVCVAAGNPGAAIAPYRRVALIHQRLGRHRAQALTLIELGDALLAIGEVWAATEELMCAYTVLWVLGDGYNTARAQLSLARAHLRDGDPTIAGRLARQALATMTRLGADHQRAAAHDVLAAVATYTGHHQRACRHRALAAGLRTPTLSAHKDGDGS